MLRQEAGHDGNGVTSNEGTASLRMNITEKNHDQERLFRAIEKVEKKIAVDMPATRLGPRGHPFPVTPKAVVGDEAVPPIKIVFDPLLAAAQFANGGKGAG